MVRITTTEAGNWRIVLDPVAMRALVQMLRLEFGSQPTYQEPSDDPDEDQVRQAACRLMDAVNDAW